MWSRLCRSLHFILLAGFAAGLLGSCAMPSREERRSAIVQNRAIALAKIYGLQDVRTAIPDIAVDLRYSSSQNVARRPLYPANMPCLLRTSTVERLRKAQATLRSQGYGLRIWDAWRPTEVQERLYSAGGYTGMFLDPRVGWSRHCGGVSIDATLVDSHGIEQRMPTYFDDSLSRASTQYRGNDPVVARNLNILHSAMKSAGLVPLTDEWWHFDDIDHLHTPIEVITGIQLGIYSPQR